MNVGDDIYLGNFVGPQGLVLGGTSSENPTAQIGAGPMARTAFLNMVPAALATANIAALQASVANVGLALAAGAGITLGVAPDGSGRTVYLLDVPRAVSLTSVSNLSGINYLVSGFDFYKKAQTQLMVGPNDNTVNSLKTWSSILSVTPQGASASTVSVGTADVFGFQFVMADACYIIHAGWDNTLAANAGTFVAADATSPATNLTGDVRGTFAQSGNASNGARRLVIAMHLNAGQCGSSPTIQNLIGVTPA